MGSNCIVELPTDVDARCLAKVVGVLAGLPSHIENDSRSSSVFARVVSVDAKTTLAPGMADIVLVAPDGTQMVDGESIHSGYFHFCARNHCGSRMVNSFHPTSTPFWCAIGKRLVEFFGGRIMYNDCGHFKGKNVYSAKRTCPVDSHKMIPDNGESWNKFQQAVVSIKPVTEAEMRAANIALNTNDR